MKLIYNNKELKVYECQSFKSRLLGLIGKTKINYALLFPHCNSVHTFFMKENIDIIMCDKDYNILAYYPDTSRNRVILPKKSVSIVIETPALYFDIKINSKIIIKK